MNRSIYLTPRMLIIGWLGLLSGLPLVLTASTLTAWLADEGVNIKTIGLFALAGIPYTFKFLWAPLMDGLNPPLLSAFGRRRGWMLWWLVALVACVWLLSMLSPEQHLHWIAVLTLCLAFSSASFDINMDALRIEWLTPEEQGAGAAIAVLGYRVGMLASSAGALYIAAHSGWSLAYQCMAGVLALGVIAIFLAKNTDAGMSEAAGESLPGAAQDSEVTALSKLSARQWITTYLLEPFRQFSTHKNWALILLFIVLFKLGDAVLGFMTMPFLIDAAGYAKEDIALVVKFYGLIATIAGGFVGGWAVLRLGIFPSLVIGGVLQSLANIAYGYLAWLPQPDILALGITISIDNAFGGFATTAFIAYVSSLCHRRFTATQYALLNSLASIGRTFVSASSGAMVAAMGWPIFFVFTAVLGLPSLAVLWLLRVKLR